MGVKARFPHAGVQALYIIAKVDGAVDNAALQAQGTGIFHGEQQVNIPGEQPFKGCAGIDVDQMVIPVRMFGEFVQIAGIVLPQDMGIDQAVVRLYIAKPDVQVFCF